MGEKLAVVIGVSRYEDPGIRDLPAAENDARAVATILGGSPYGFDVQLLLNDEASRDNILKILFQARQRVPSDMVFYFAGHGAKSEIGTSLVLKGAREHELGITLAELFGQRLSSFDCTVSAILDCCHSGAAVPRSLAEPLRSDDLQRSLNGASSTIYAIAACAGDQLAYESGETNHGALTLHLIDGLKGGAADALGRITPTSLFTFISAPFEADTKQSPCFHGWVSSDVVLAQGFPPRAARTDAARATEMITEASGAIDRYLDAKHRGGHEDLRLYGFKQDCLKLDEVVRWFAKLESLHSELSDNSEYNELVRTLRNEQAYLCNLRAGMNIPGGTTKKLLGSGGFGAVWLVESDDGSPRAFKVYHSNDLWDRDKVGRFLTGYRANRQLSHPNIVSVFEERLVPLGFYMEAIDGPNLRDAGASSWDVSARLEFLISAADTLSYAHESGVIHRDIKPENVLVRWDPAIGSYEPVISDFDLAWFTTATQRTQAAMGMALYAPPEQRDFSSQLAVRKTTVDIFAFAQVAFFVLAGRDPQVNRISRNAASLQRALADELPAAAVAELVDFYTNCSHYDPGERWQSLEPAVRALRSAWQSREVDRSGGLIPVEVFLQELRSQVSGEISTQKPSPIGFSIQSRTGRTTVDLMRVHDRGDSAGWDFRFRPREEFGAQGLKNEEIRRSLNQQIDRLLKSSATVAKRRSGHQGVYEVFVDIDPVSLNGAGVACVADVCLGVIRKIEAMHV